MSADVHGEDAALCERFRMAYAEAGYPNANVEWDPWRGLPGVVPESINFDEMAAWRAGLVVYGPVGTPCFECWKDEHSRTEGAGLLCAQGDCQTVVFGRHSQDEAVG